MGLGLGLGIWWPIQTSIIPGILKPLKARATYFENVRCTTATLQKIENIQYTAPALPVGLLASYPGASAAYSLRNLINTTTSVVRVRRSIDNTEQDFSATQITDGTLTTFTGANDGFVTTWYDQSGNGNNMTQVSALSQPNLVTNGSIVLSNNKPTLLFDQSSLSQSVNLNSSEAEHFLVIEASLYPPTSQQQTGLYQYNPSTSVNSHYSWTNGEIYDGFATSSRKTFTPPETLAKLNLYNVLSKSSEWSARLNSNEIFTTSNNTVNFGSSQRLGSNYSSSYHLKGYISEFMVYPSDQSTNRNGIETNINTNYGIFPETGLLADYPNASVAYSLRNLSNITTNVVRVRRSSDNTEQNFTSTEITDGTLTTFTGTNDGFVTIWYDQSRYSNDATQSTASEQPKLVTNGVVELDNGKPCLRYDTTGNDSFNLTTRLTNARSTFSVVNFVYNSGDLTQYLFGDNSSFDYVSGNNTLLSSEYAASFVKLGDNKVNNISSDFTTTARPLVQSLVSMIHTSSAGRISRISDDRNLSNSRSLQGKLQEIIIYSTDQSSNRTGIETNINNEYTIY